MAQTAPQPPTPPVPGQKPTPPDEIVALGQLVSVLGQDPKYRTRVLELIREADPNLPIPELDVRREFHSQVEERTKPVIEENTKLRERLDSLEGSIRRDRWASEQGLSDEEMIELEAFAKEKKVADPSAALEYYRLGRPRSTGRVPEFSVELRKEYAKNPRATALREGERILAEMRRKRGA